MPLHLHTDTIYHIAESQDSFITAQDAKSAKIPPISLIKLSRTKTLERTSRGVYRLVRYPVDELTQFWDSVLWARSHNGINAVLSFDTALLLYIVSDVNPERIHLTIPKAARLRRDTPPLIELHRETLDPMDRTHLSALPITTFSKTIHDCKKAGKSADLLQQAIENAILERLLTIEDAASLKEYIA